MLQSREGSREMGKEEWKGRWNLHTLEGATCMQNGLWLKWREGRWLCVVLNWPISRIWCPSFIGDACGFCSMQLGCVCQIWVCGRFHLPFHSSSPISLPLASSWKLQIVNQSAKRFGDLIGPLCNLELLMLRVPRKGPIKSCMWSHFLLMALHIAKRLWGVSYLHLRQKF